MLSCKQFKLWGCPVDVSWAEPENGPRSQKQYILHVARVPKMSIKHLTNIFNKCSLGGVKELKRMEGSNNLLVHFTTRVNAEVAKVTLNGESLDDPRMPMRIKFWDPSTNRPVHTY